MDAGDSAPIPNGTESTDTFPFTSRASRDNKSANAVVDKEAYFYKMTHPQRGIAVIFNHEKFLVPNLKDRSGTQADCDNLKNVWQKLGFTVVVHQDLGIKALSEELDKLSKNDFSQMDCLVICVLSHGEEGIIYAKDTAYKHDTLWQKFTADNCKTLAGKPKLFFIQACQGTRLDPGIELRSNAEVDGGVSAYKIPIHADFLFAYSTIPDKQFKIRPSVKNKNRHSFLNCFNTPSLPAQQNEAAGCGCDGFTSWRRDRKGGWFINALCYELHKWQNSCDLVTILTFVNRRVATDYQTNPGENEMQAPGKKQIPCITSMLTRLIAFFTKEDSKSRVESTPVDQTLPSVERIEP